MFKSLFKHVKKNPTTSPNAPRAADYFYWKSYKR